MRALVIRLFLLSCLSYPALSSALTTTPMAAAGYAHTLAVSDDGTLKAWGDNTYGQLGIGTAGGSLVPKKVLTGVMAAAAGDSHSVARKSDGTVWAWGDNSYGQLGDGTTLTRLKPKKIKGPTGVVGVAAGLAHTVALKSDGTVMTWGYNGDGELGDGTTNDSLVPITVPGLTGVIAISVGPSGSHTLALKSDGTVVAWGYNGDGELGDGTIDNSLSPIAVPGLAGVIAVAAGDAHSLAVKSDGSVVAWGSNFYGQLGDGTGADSLVPVAVAGLAAVVAISAGDAHSVAVTSDGTVAGWGYNGDGELGDGTSNDSLVPVTVPGLNGVIAAAAGYYHTAVMKLDGLVLAWGYNLDGELGDGTTNDSLVPVEAVGLTTGAVNCNLNSAVNMVNSCVPEVSLYIAGASSLAGALEAVIPSDLFDTSSRPVARIIDNGSASGSAVMAWYGMSKATLTGGTKRLFVVYNNKNGSGAGVSQLLVTQNPSNAPLLPEADVVAIGPALTGANNLASNNCIVDASSTPLQPVIACTSHASMQADLAISSVNATELSMLENPASGNLGALNKLAITPLALQGFGVAVNHNLYTALQTANQADGLIPPSCTAGSTSAACQPTLRRADYASLVSGRITSAAELFNNSDATELTLARLGDLSGTQAASNIFFADNPCGNDRDSAGNLIAGVPGGQLGVIASTDSILGLVVQANATTQDVMAALNAPGGYAVGVLGLGAVPGAGDTWRFVKLDGVSPNFNLDGSADAYQRNAFINGYYPFAMTSFALYLAKPSAKATGKLFPNMITAVVNGLKDSTLHNLTGIGYLDHAANPQQSLVSRGGAAILQGKANPLSGNNCAPLIKM